MSRFLVLTVVLAIVAGIIGGFLYGEVSQEATAQQRNLPVKGQHLDANGFTRAHEQGTADVNVVGGSVDVANLPLDKQGNLKVATTNAEKIHVLAENGFIPLGGDAFGPVDTSGCTRFAVIVRARLGTSLEKVVVRLGLGLGGAAADINVEPTLLRVLGHRAYAVFAGAQGTDGQLHEVFAPTAIVAVSIQAMGFLFDTIALTCLP